MGHGNLSGDQLPQWTGDDASYRAVHARLRRRRGPARDYSCTACGVRRAYSWAYDLTDPHEKVSPQGARYSVDLDRYVPMCASCHKLQDVRAAGRSACGTEAGYYHHRRAGTPACNACLQAHAAATRRRVERRAVTLTDPDLETTP